MGGNWSLSLAPVMLESDRTIRGTQLDGQSSSLAAPRNEVGSDRLLEKEEGI